MVAGAGRWMDGWADSIALCVWVAEQCVGRGRAGRERRQDWDGADEFFRDAPPLEIEARHVLGGGGGQRPNPAGGWNFGSHGFLCGFPGAHGFPKGFPAQESTLEGRQNCERHQSDSIPSRVTSYILFLPGGSPHSRCTIFRQPCRLPAPKTRTGSEPGEPAGDPIAKESPPAPPDLSSQGQQRSEPGDPGGSHPSCPSPALRS